MAAKRKIHLKKPAVRKRRATKLGLPGLGQVLPEIQTLIESSRQHVVSTANLTLVWLYWNVGRVITQDIQKNQKRAGYGEQLLAALAGKLTSMYGRGFSRPNLQDMRRFFEGFEICSAVPSKSFASPIPQALPVESSPHIAQTVSAKSGSGKILQSVTGQSLRKILPPAVAESEERPIIDFSQHHRLGCTSKKQQHVELLLGHGPHKMQVSEYLTQLPSKRVLADRLKIYSRMLVERANS